MAPLLWETTQEEVMGEVFLGTDHEYMACAVEMNEASSRARFPQIHIFNSGSMVMTSGN